MLHIMEPDNPNCAVITHKRVSGDHVIETLFICDYGTTLTVTENLSSINENMKTVPVSAALTFPEDSQWCMAIPEMAHRVGVFFNFNFEDALDRPSDTAALTVYTFILGCIKVGTNIIPITILDPINTVRPASTCTIYANMETLRPCVCVYEGTATVPSQLLSANIPAGISHIAVIKRLKDITAHPLTGGTLQTNVHFW